MDEQKKYYSILTDIGRALLANAAVKGEKVDLTKFAVGDGNGGFYSPTGDMRTLKNETWRGVIAKYEIDEVSENIINVTAILSSDVGGFTIREMGIYTAKDELFALCNCPDTAKVIIDEGISSEMELTMSLIISNTSQIKFEVDPTVILATKKDIEKHNQSPTAHESHTKNKELHVTKEWKDNTSSAIGELIEHSNNKIVHVTENKQVQWDAAYLLSLENKRRLDLLANRVENHETRVQRLEDGLFNNITGNPFLITFGNLEGVILTKGIWNKALQRIEC